jgi:hypothetical protein
LYDYLLEAPAAAAALAGGQCIPVRLPQAARLVWHKLSASTQRQGFPEKTAKDRQQAAVLAAALAEQEPEALHEAFSAAPSSMTPPLPPLIPLLGKLLGSHPMAREMLVGCLSWAARAGPLCTLRQAPIAHPEHTGT